MDPATASCDATAPAGGVRLDEVKCSHKDFLRTEHGRRRGRGTSSRPALLPRPARQEGQYLREPAGSQLLGGTAWNLYGTTAWDALGPDQVGLGQGTRCGRPPLDPPGQATLRGRRPGEPEDSERLEPGEQAERWDATLILQRRRRKIFLIVGPRAGSGDGFNEITTDDLTRASCLRANPSLPPTPPGAVDRDRCGA
jgi:hypothetical protein